MIRRLLLLTVIGVLCGLSAMAQSMSVASFCEDPKDPTANLAGTAKKDSQGKVCSLIKISTTQKGFAFDNGSLGIVAVEPQNANHPAEIWLYVPMGTKKLTIQHPQLGQIKKYDLGSATKPATVYLLELTTDQVMQTVMDFSNEQAIIINVTPPTAKLLINGMRQQLDTKGHCEVTLPFGTHNYRISAPDFHDAEGSFDINDKVNKHKLDVRLKQAFGYLSLDAPQQFQGAKVYVDSVAIGVLPIKNYNLVSGTHDIRVEKPLYSDFAQRITMTDSAFVNITPTFSDNFGEVEIVCSDKNANIYVDANLLAVGSWKGKLGAGKHSLESRRLHYRDGITAFSLAKNEKKTITLAPPTPIYGRLQVNSSPSGAVVFIDGNSVGTTPYFSGNLLEGQHYIKLVKKGCTEYSGTFNIKDGQRTDLNLALETRCTSEIVTSPSWATLSINGVYQKSKSLDLEPGDYNVGVWAGRHFDYYKRMHLDGSSPKVIKISLRYMYVRPNEYYLGVGYNMMGIEGISFTTGGFIRNFNMEATFNLPMGKSEDIYWNYTDPYGYGNDYYQMEPLECAYKPLGGNVKIGWGIRIGSRMRLTPQIGCQLLQLSSTKSSNGVDTGGIGLSLKPSACSMLLGGRLTFAIAKALQISVAPQYACTLSQSDGYKALSELSDKIKKYKEGFSCNFGLNIYFR